MKHWMLLGALGVLACSKGTPSGAPSAPAVASVSLAAPAATPLVAPSAVASVAAPPPSAASAAEVRYAVTGVAANDVLNVREKPDVASKKVYSFAPGVKSIRLTGQHQEKGGTPWVEVAFEGGTGWLNRTFLAEMHEGGGCNDPEVAALIRAFMKAVGASDSLALKATVSPLRGLTVKPEHHALKFTGVQLDTLFSSKTVLNLGPGDGGGPNITGTFKEQIEPSLRDSILKKGAQEKCGKILAGASTSPPPTVDSFSGTPVSFFYPGQEGSNDWVTWVGSIEYVEGKPYFYDLQRFHWSI